jgi:hypothetical protein
MKSGVPDVPAFEESSGVIVDSGEFSKSDVAVG